jgi:hypothetical protein
VKRACARLFDRAFYFAWGTEREEDYGSIDYGSVDGPLHSCMCELIALI